MKNLSKHRKDEASRGDNAFIFNFCFQSWRVNNVVTFSIERHVLLREFFFFIFGFGFFFIFKVIQARLICTSCLVQKKQSKLVVPASSQIHVTSVFRIATSSSSSSPTSSLPRSQLQEKRLLFSYNCCFKQPVQEKRTDFSLSLVPHGTCALDQEACARIVFAILMPKCQSVPNFVLEVFVQIEKE